jgi:hypothetical protein
LGFWGALWGRRGVVVEGECVVLFVVLLVVVVEG